MAVKRSVYKSLGIPDGAKLPIYAWPGGYPVFYLDDAGTVLCPFCANNHDDYSGIIVGSEINWEDSNMHCDDCGRRIESAYAE